MGKLRAKPISLKITPRRLREYQAGKTTLQQLSALYRVSISTMWRELKRQGITRNSRRGRPANPKRHQQIIDMAAQGWTRRKIADHLGITPEWVRAVLAQYGFVVSLRILKCPGCGGPVAKGHKAQQNPLALCKNCLNPGKVVSFGKRLKSFRLAENLSLEELSYRSGLSKTLIGNYEREEANPTDESAQKLAQSLGLSLSAFRGESSIPHLPNPHPHNQ